MYLNSRRFLCSLVSVLVVAGTSWAEEALQEVPSQQRRELWDFFSFVSLLAQIGPKPCTRPDGTADWGPEHGPRWRHCSKEASSTTDTTVSYATSEETTEYSEYMEYSASTSESGEAGTSSITSSGAVQGFQWWMLIVAGSVLSAMAAIRMGQRKEPMGDRKHDMSGAVMRRVGAVNAFASGLFPSNGSKVVEMQAARPEYKLDMSRDEDRPYATV